MIEDMRTTIEIDDDVRAALVYRAAQRGERGFSSLVNEVLRRHFQQEAPSEGEVSQFEHVLRTVAGSLSEEDAAELLGSIAESRNNWPER
jgi:predicted CopG family antitoxin